ncbi:MAG: hypothetical protein FWF78_02560 [Defluviitaleaceae bacterium]|nr:hypothetical protein [Defluviitaleaceae bacterium]
MNDHVNKKLKDDVLKYKAFFEQLDRDGHLNDHLTNDGLHNDEKVEMENLVRFKNTMEEEGILSFMD